MSGQGEVVRVIDRPLAELTCDLHRPRVKVGVLAEFYSRSEQVLQKPHRIPHGQFAQQDPPVKGVRHFDRQQVGRCGLNSVISP